MYQDIVPLFADNVTLLYYNDALFADIVIMNADNHTLFADNATLFFSNLLLFIYKATKHRVMMHCFDSML